MNDETVGICMSAEVAFEPLEVACAGMVHVQFLLGEKVNRHRCFIFGAQKIDQDEELPMMDSNFRPPDDFGALLLHREANDGF